MKPYKVDEKGEQILRIISDNSRVNASDIAKQINSSEEEVKEYIKKFEDERIILGYRANVNWQRVRQDDVKALIEVKVTPERKVGFDAVAESIYRFPEVSTVFLISGAYDLLVQVDGLSLREVAQFVSEKLATIKGVQSTTTHFLLKKYKEDGVILVEHPESKRLPVTP
ncbi:MAG TPA: Lrp/AsnC family transcriptional regulator [Spirochaetota bacterium]|nr:Lrp/AsnC family transcriptional regulator [Spirochaetota bacterium]HPJ36202.1 Lrp/AsnC family transcriptional regulator [Spirochaetota bacterium]